MDLRKLKKYLKKNNFYVILIVLSTLLVRCELIFNSHIRPEKPPYFEIGDTLIYNSSANVDSFYVESAILLESGETINGELPESDEQMVERFTSSMIQIDCSDTCYKFTSYVTPTEYRIGVYGIVHSSYTLWHGIEGHSLKIGQYELENLYRKALKTDSITGKEISTVYYSKKYGVVEYELTNGEIFDLDEACITMMEERHK